MVEVQKFVPFAEREKWADIEPVEQYEGGAAPICPIPYPQEYVDTMNYFRAILKRSEVSERAFELTSEVIKIAGGNYSAWFWRRKCLDELGHSLAKEMQWLQVIGLEQIKSYQIWHHRRCIAEILGSSMDIDAEMNFLSAVFAQDSKCYHAWSYRIWLVERFQLWADELKFTDELLDEEVTNNSVWSYRYFLLSKAPTGTLSSEVFGSVENARQESLYTLKRLSSDPDNEAAWVYLRGFYSVSAEEALQSQTKGVKRVHVLELTEILLTQIEAAQTQSNEKGPIFERFMTMTLADIHLAKNRKDEAQECFEKLRDSIDKIRMKYWQWRINNLN